MTDPTAAFFAELRRIHQRADEPSPQAIARLIGQPTVSAGVVRAALFGPRLASWAKLRIILQALGADLDRVHALWMAAHARPAPETASEPDAPAAGAAAPPSLDPIALQDWMDRYQSTEAAAGPSGTTAPETGVERLARLEPLAAFRLLAELPPAVAGRRLAALDDKQPIPIVTVMGTDALDMLIHALPQSPQRDRLRKLRPRPRPRPRIEPPAEPSSAIEQLRSLDPEIVKDWNRSQ